MSQACSSSTHNCASVPAKNIYASGVLGQYFPFGEGSVGSSGESLHVISD